MITKNDMGYCGKCGKKITNKNLGDTIEAEEIIVCDSCAKKHMFFVITELNKFRHSKEFKDRLALRNKILWASESLGHLFDSANKKYIESVSDYDNYNIFELQVTLLDILQTELECYLDANSLEGDYEKAIKKYPEMEKLRLEVRKQQGNIASYINIEEFVNK